MDLIIGLTGASGVIYGIHLLKALHDVQNCTIHLIVSKNAKQLLDHETNLKLSELIDLSDHYYENTDLTGGLASGSNKFDGMVIIPCTMSTAAKLNCGITDNLITRTADVCLKERRKLIIVPRETPCNTTHLKNLFELSQKGVIVLPAMPAFYHLPRSLDDLINFMAGKILEQFDIEHKLYTRWQGKKAD